MIILERIEVTPMNNKFEHMRMKRGYFVVKIVNYIENNQIVKSIKKITKIIKEIIRKESKS